MLLESGKEYRACLICLKTNLPAASTFKNVEKSQVSDGDEEEVKERKDLYSRFLLFIGRYLSLRLTSKKLLQSYHNHDKSRDLNQVPFCVRCCHVVDDICGLFERLEVIEMRLKWKLREMGAEMETGSRSVSKKLGRGLMTRLAKQMHVPRREAVERFREVVRLKCKGIWNESVPKVILEKSEACLDDNVRKTTMRLIIVYALAFLAESLVKAIEEKKGNSVSDKNMEDVDNLREEEDEVAVKMELEDEVGGDQQEAIDEDSDWSGGGIASPTSNISSVEEENEVDVSNPTPRKRKWNLRSQGNPAVKGDKVRRKALPRPKKKRLVGRPKSSRLPKTKPLNTTWSCKECNLTFHRKPAQMLHIRTHHPNNILGFPGFCEVCGLFFQKTHLRDKHWTTEHNGTYSCLTCQMTFPKNKLLWSHLAVHEIPTEKSFCCPYCLRGFTQKQLYDLHTKLAHSKNWSRYPCISETCSDVFDKLPELTEHLKQCHLPPSGEDALLFCDICPKPFLDKARMEVHRLTHLPQDPQQGYKCPHCTEYYPNIRSLIIHFNKMHGLSIKPLKCKICGESFFRMDVLRWHYKNLHKDNPEVVQKWLEEHSRGENKKGHGELKKAARKKYKLRKRKVERLLLNPGSPLPSTSEEIRCLKTKGHLPNMEIEEMTFFKVVVPSCEVETCRKQFPSAYLLRKHLEVEHEEGSEVAKTLACYHCDKWFHLEQTRGLHFAAVHRKFRRNTVGKELNQYKCDFKECFTPAFGTVAELNLHLKCHLPLTVEETGGEIKYCSKCQWGFFQQETLLLHELCHVPKDLVSGHYSCPLCNVYFPRIFGLRLHYASIHLSITCKFCGKGFRTKNSLWPHISRCHGGANGARGDSVEAVSPKQKKIYRRNPHSRHGKCLPCTCEICGEVFPDKHRLGYHQKQVHNKVLDFVCDQCGQSFQNKAHLDYHLIGHQESRLPCEICGKLFKRPNSVKRHMETVHNPQREVDQICNICGKSFLSWTGREWHMQANHTPESEWKLQCTKCPKRFYRSSLRDLHMKRCKGGEEGN